MKKLMISAALAALVAGASTGAFAVDTSEQMRDVPDFTEVALKGSMDVDIKVGSAKSVKVIADSDIIDHVQTEVEGDRLVIDMERGTYRNIRVLRLEITVPSLAGAAIYGSGDLTANGIDGDSFDLDLKGSGDATLKGARFGKVSIDLAGSGDITMAGECETVEVDLKGSGDIEAAKLTCKEAEVSLKGSGDVAVYASSKANVEIRGSGDVSVTGKPDTVRSNVRGSGEIIVD